MNHARWRARASVQRDVERRERSECSRWDVHRFCCEKLPLEEAIRRDARRRGSRYSWCLLIAEDGSVFHRSLEPDASRTHARVDKKKERHVRPPRSCGQMGMARRGPEEAKPHPNERDTACGIHKRQLLCRACQSERSRRGSVLLLG
jgi:hypothetical protein